MLGLQTVTGLPGNMLGKRPFFTSWFIAHISRCIQLWKADRGLQNALELAKSFMAPIDYLASLWPSEGEWLGVFLSLLLFSLSFRCTHKSHIYRPKELVCNAPSGALALLPRSRPDTPAAHRPDVPLTQDPHHLALT